MLEKNIEFRHQNIMKRKFKKMAYDRLFKMKTAL